MEKENKVKENAENGEKKENPIPKKGDSIVIVKQPHPTSKSGVSSAVQIPLVGAVLVRGGLEGLALTSHLLVRQRVELLEVVCGCDMPNQYEVFDSRGVGLYYMREDTGCALVWLLRTHRCFAFTVMDHNQRPVFYITRSCSSCCLAAYCCGKGNEVNVTLADGTFLGSVEQNCTICRATFDVKNSSGMTALKIVGPECCLFRMCCNVEFQVMDMNGVLVGSIHKHWTGIIQEFLSNADNFGIEFPTELDISIKAVLLGAVILIDFAFFEHGRGGAA